MEQLETKKKILFPLIERTDTYFETILNATVKIQRWFRSCLQRKHARNNEWMYVVLKYYVFLFQFFIFLTQRAAYGFDRVRSQFVFPSHPSGKTRTSTSSFASAYLSEEHWS